MTSGGSGDRPPGRERLTPSGRRAHAISTIIPFMERARTFSGWNFDDLRVTPLDPLFANGRETPWDYVALARESVSGADRVIDLGTGGGEVFSRIVDGLKGPRFYAGEEWHVNAPVARDRLRPLGVEVLHASSERTPYKDAAFDVVLSRHEAIDPPDIVRILRPDGVFLTQQVAKEQWRELTPLFPNRTVFPDHFVEYARAFEDAGFVVTTQHHTWRAAYATIGEVAYMLMIAPWEFPEFDAMREIDSLLALEDAHGTAEGIVLTLARYLLVARKRSR